MSHLFFLSFLSLSFQFMSRMERQAASKPSSRVAFLFLFFFLLFILLFPAEICAQSSGPTQPVLLPGDVVAGLYAYAIPTNITIGWLFNNQTILLNLLGDALMLQLLSLQNNGTSSLSQMNAAQAPYSVLSSDFALADSGLQSMNRSIQTVSQLFSFINAAVADLPVLLSNASSTNTSIMAMALDVAAVNATVQQVSNLFDSRLQTTTALDALAASLQRSVNANVAFAASDFFSLNATIFLHTSELAALEAELGTGLLNASILQAWDDFLYYTSDSYRLSHLPFDINGTIVGLLLQSIALVDSAQATASLTASDEQGLSGEAATRSGNILWLSNFRDSLYATGAVLKSNLSALNASFSSMNWSELEIMSAWDLAEMAMTTINQTIYYIPPAPPAPLSGADQLRESGAVQAWLTALVSACVVLCALVAQVASAACAPGAHGLPVEATALSWLGFLSFCAVGFGLASVDGRNILLAGLIFSRTGMQAPDGQIQLSSCLLYATACSAVLASCVVGLVRTHLVRPVVVACLILVYATVVCPLAILLVWSPSRLPAMMGRSFIDDCGAAVFHISAAAYIWPLLRFVHVPRPAAVSGKTVSTASCRRLTLSFGAVLWPWIVWLFVLLGLEILRSLDTSSLGYTLVPGFRLDRGMVVVCFALCVSWVVGVLSESDGAGGADVVVHAVAAVSAAPAYLDFFAVVPLVAASHLISRFILTHVIEHGDRRACSHVFAHWVGGTVSVVAIASVHTSKGIMYNRDTGPLMLVQLVGGGLVTAVCLLCGYGALWGLRRVFGADHLFVSVERRLNLVRNGSGRSGLLKHTRSEMVLQQRQQEQQQEPSRSATSMKRP